MSFMPDVGARVRLIDGALATVTDVTPDGSGDRVRLDTDGSERHVSAWDIAEVLAEPAAATETPNTLLESET